MKIVILISTSIFLVGFTVFMQGIFGNTEKAYHKSEQKAQMNYEDYSKSFRIDKSIDQPKELGYEVRGLYTRSVKQDQLKGAQLLSDIISDYPINWITNYVSVEIMGTCNGEFLVAKGSDIVFTAEQKHILNNVDMATDVVINVNYTYKVPVTNVLENNTMHVLMTVVPNTQAQNIGGYAQLISYLKENSLRQFSKIDPEKFRQVVIRFTVNEEGKVCNAKITRGSGDTKTEKILLDAIYGMPAWKPAENAEGIKIKQEFEFVIGSNVGGC